ncbi:UDP-glucose 4-epimerase GalE [Plesiomonas shigelloides]|uniref:UDP-glucose 4-epimerase GalE n=1 Tax=Plesiomonas shigelloides TaxID=703 RepID=UPI001261D46A|nr:UDP-glucose 4-epimerase GalE [Plesiomonas shigelloides]KAB7711450.1 UDP-glucose 4-epimerase GalE [Plesiomonas shigelloides]
MAILVTGGAGYIGSHTVLELLNSGNDVVIIDNLCNSSRESLRRVETLTGRSVTFYEADVCDRSALQTIFAQHAIDAVIHFAGLKAVGESAQIPLKYYQNNIAATLVLCEEMERAGVFRLVFSSSATVYGDPHTVPIQEHFPTSATNPYGRSKLMVEEMLRDIVAADPRWSVVLLRYFNPVGAHISGQIGEDPNGIPNNLLPYIAQVAIGRLKQLSVFGNDYPTPDGTGVRDYIHVVDLSLGHLKALQYIADRHGVFTFNLGTGQGYSVLEMVKAFEQASGRAVPYQVVARRPGDIAVCYAEPDLAAQELGWRAERGLPEMMADTWRWQSQNPNGYKD